MWSAETLLAVFITIAAHSAAVRFSRSHNAVVSFVFFCLVGGVGVILWLGENYGLRSPQTFAGALLFFFLCELYLFLFTLAMTSVSVSLIRRLAVRNLDDEQIDKIYDSRQMVDIRINRLVAGQFLAENAGALQLTPKGSFLVRVFTLLRNFFHHTNDDRPGA